MTHASGLSDVQNDLHFLKESFSTSRQIGVELLTAFTQLGGGCFVLARCSNSNYKPGVQFIYVSTLIWSVFKPLLSKNIRGVSGVWCYVIYSRLFTPSSLTARSCLDVAAAACSDCYQLAKQFVRTVDTSHRACAQPVQIGCDSSVLSDASEHNHPSLKYLGLPLNPPWVHERVCRRGGFNVNGTQSNVQFKP